MKKLILLFIGVLLFSFGFELTKVEANTRSSDLKFVVTNLTTSNNNSSFTVEIRNSSSSTYSFGWVNSCQLVVKTDKGEYKQTLSSIRDGRINPGTNTYNYNFNTNGVIVSIYFTDIRKLDDRGLPIHNLSLTEYCDLSLVSGSLKPQDNKPSYPEGDTSTKPQVPDNVTKPESNESSGSTSGNSGSVNGIIGGVIQNGNGSSSGSTGGDTIKPLEPITFKLVSVTNFGTKKAIKVKVNNNTDRNFSFGWVGSCTLKVVTTEKEVIVPIDSGKINPGEKDYTYIFDATGDIVSLSFKDIILLNDKNLPLDARDLVYTCDVNDYSTFNGITIVVSIIAGFFVIVFLLFMVLKSSVSFGKVFGYSLQTIGVIGLVIGFAGSIFKPQLGQSDFWFNTQLYWIIGMVSMIIGGLGKALTNKSKRNTYKGYHTNDSFNQYMIDEQNRQFQEQNRLFQEQVQRDIQQQDDMNRMQQDNFNNFNNPFF